MITVLSVLLFGFLTPNERCSPANKKYSEEQNDGPYVLYKGDQIFIKYIIQKVNAKSVLTDSIPVSGKSATTLWINTDEPGKKFSLQLKKKIQNENAEYPYVSKLLALSDIEGEF